MRGQGIDNQSACTRRHISADHRKPRPLQRQRHAPAHIAQTHYAYCPHAALLELFVMLM